MARLIFVNSSGWLALYNPNDPNHEAAKQLWADLSQQRVRLVTTDYVMDQVFTALKFWGSLHAAVAFNEVVRNSSLIRLFIVDSVVFDRAWRTFKEDDFPSWTFTDCLNYAVIQYLGVTEVVTFDPLFSSPDLTTLPLPA
jgi:predicted nucleic acid-binding protein